MILIFIILGLLWVVLGVVSLFFGAAYGLDRVKVRREILQLLDRNYLSSRGVALVLDIFASLFWIPVSFPVVGFSVGCLILLLLI